MKAKKVIETRVNRRGFLKAATGAAIGAGVMASQTANAVPESVEDNAGVEDKSAKGYHLTQHILDYYKSAAV